MIWLASLWSKFQGWIVAAGAFVALAVGVYVKGRSDQKNTNETKELKKTVKNIETARKVENEVRKMSPTDVDRGLDRWMRD